MVDAEAFRILIHRILPFPRHRCPQVYRLEKKCFSSPNVEFYFSERSWNDLINYHIFNWSFWFFKRFDKKYDLCVPKDCSYDFLYGRSRLCNFLAQVIKKNLLFELFFSFWCIVLNPCFGNSYELTPKTIWISL